MDLTTFLNTKGFRDFEGNSRQVPAQVEDLIQLTSNGKIRILEIGFNAGHSADTILKNNKEATMVSFDLGLHPYVTAGKEYIDAVYPNRHLLVLGNSVLTIPLYLERVSREPFDVIFIDGGHDYDIAKQDMENCRHVAHSDTLVLLDDTMFTEEWTKEYTIGPTQVWKEQIEQQRVIEIQHKDYCYGRGMSWGKYRLSI